MKLYNQFLVCGTLLFGAMAFTGCSSDDEDFDVEGNYYNKVSFNPAASSIKECTIYNTPGGVFGEVGGEFAVQAQYSTSSTFNVAGTVDNTYVEAFNEKNGSLDLVYHEMPANVVSAVQISNATIRPGTNIGDNMKVEIPNSVLSSLTEEYYVLPVKMSLASSTQGDSKYTPDMRDEYDVVYVTVHNDMANFAYATSSTTQTSKIIQTPVGTFGNIDLTFNYAIRAANTGEALTIKATVDNSLIKEYNDLNETSYEQLPEEIMDKLQITDGSIATDASATDPGVKIYASEEDVKDVDGAYLVPLKMTLVYANGQSLNLGNAYVIVKSEHSLINDSATALLGTVCDLTELQTNSKLISSSNFMEDYFSNLFTSSGYMPFTEAKSSAACVIDLGTTHKISGFSMSSYVMNSCSVYVSEDGNTWTELGSTSGHNTVRVREGWTSYYWYVLYAGVSARYVKLEFDLNPDHTYWRYRQYGTYYLSYSALRQLKFTYDDPTTEP